MNFLGYFLRLFFKGFGMVWGLIGWGFYLEIGGMFEARVYLWSFVNFKRNYGG